MNISGIVVEVTGLTLACLEIYLPHFSEKLEELIDKTGDRLKIFRENISNWLEQNHKKWVNRIVFTILFLIFIFLVFGVRTPTEYDSEQRTLMFIILGGSFIVFGIFIHPVIEFILLLLFFIPYLIITILELLIRFLNGVTGGKAIGTIGLFLGVTGLIFEIT